ncbi:MAG: ABC transporter permease subunit [Verrucomicrobiota bacterium]|nr:ABC transporter permease subunit [Verrucomicrobiota bacterium]
MSQGGSQLDRPHLNDPWWIRLPLIAIVVGFLVLFLLLPLVVVFVEALKGGIGPYIKAVTDPRTLAALKLTLIVSGSAVILNTIFGVMAAWCLTKFQFKGKSFLTSLIDLPFAVSPVIAGLIFVLVFGRQGWLGTWGKDFLELFGHLAGHYQNPIIHWALLKIAALADVKIIFALPGIIIATTFITFPFVARELIPLMQTQGIQNEETAASLGATGWKTFWRVTLPSIKWALLYGIILCNARAMGEFGAVSVVSGHQQKTNTLPLHIELLYNEYQFTSAYAVASILALLALVTLILKQLIESHLHSKA